MTKLIKSLNGKEFLAKYARHAEKDKNGNSLELGISNDRIVSIGGKSIAGGGGGGGTDYTPGNGIDITGSVISVKPDVLQGATRGSTAYQKPSAGIPSSDMSDAVQASLGKADSALQQHQDISGKADKSEMSVTPGTGTDSDKVTVQLKAGLSAKVLKEHQDISGKQDTIGDLDSIRSGATAGASAYQKPSGGIPSSDMSETVQTYLRKADSAYQKPQSGIPDSDLSESVQASLSKADTALQQQDISGKADKSEMAVTQGTGADSDKTTIQLKAGMTATVLRTHQDISGKQDTISDLESIRSGAGKGETAYQKPVAGIPKGDLANDVQTSLGKADTALQQQDISGKADKSEMSITPGTGNTTIQLQTGLSAIVLTAHQDISGKVDKVVSATEGNFAAFDSNGNIADSGKKSGDFATAAQGSLADSAYQKPSTGIPDTDMSSAVQTALGKAGTAYQKPGTGIPKTDLDSSVQTSLGKADSALQSQDITGKVDKISGGTAGNILVMASDGGISDSGSSMSDMQPKLIPGANITIVGNTISAVGGGGGGGTDYTPGTGILISGTTISVDPNVVQQKLTPGSNISIASDGTISATDTTYSSESAAEGGTAVSLVTTGEKYAWGQKYGKPSGGIPGTDLAQAVNDSLNKADNSIQGVKVNNVALTPDSNGEVNVTVPAAQQNSDWNATSGITQILNRPNLATVATTGAYSDLSGTPTIPTVDQSYSSSSANAQSGVAVASAISGVRQVPAAQSSDSGKVLGVTDSSGTIGWVEPSGSDLPSTTGNSGKVLKVNSGGTGVEWADDNDTTYESKSAASGGTEASLVTTGEKYNWNSKQDAISDLSAIREGAAAGATAVQPAALSDYNTHIADSDIHVTASDKSTWSAKQDALTFDGVYNASTNKVATESTVTGAINALDAEVSSSDGTNVQLKVTETNGKVTSVSVTTDNTENKNNKVSSWSSTVTDTNYPSEKLVKESLDLKANVATTYTKAETDAAIAAVLSNYGGFKIVSLTTGDDPHPDVPDAEASDKFIYLTKVSTAPGDDKYKSWIAVITDDTDDVTGEDTRTVDWELIGDVSMDLSGYWHGAITESGSGNAVIEISVSQNGAVTVTKGTITSANNGTLTITVGSSAAKTFGANQSTDESITIPVAKTTNNGITAYAEGLIPANDMQKLDGIESGANNYTHPSHTAHASGLYKVTVDSEGHVSAATVVAKTDITALGIQETISDLSTIRSGAEAGATAYQLPANGIPSTDLSSEVNTSLSLANSALQSHQDISGKADKVSSPTSGNFAGLDSNGNLTDSGSKASDFATSAQGGKADSAIQGVSVNGSALTPDSNKVVSITVPAAANDAKLKLKLGSGSATDTGFTANASSDQTIEIPLATHVTSGETVTNTDGLMSGSDKEKLDGIEAGANNYTHPSYTERESGLYKVTVNDTGHVSSVTPAQKSDITALGIPGSDTTYESKQAAEGGTAVSLVTTGEKYDWGAKYSKPSGGIPSTDLSSAVQTSLDKADTALQSSDLNGVASKVSGATTGNLAALDSSGDLVDSGKKASDFATAEQGALAASAIQGVKVNNVALTPDANGAVDITVPSAPNDGKLFLQLGSGSATATGFTANAVSDVTVAIPSAGYVTGESSTTYTEGLMSGQDKEKLAGIAANANNYTHPSNTAHESGLYKVTVDGLGHVTAASAVEKSDITGLGIPGSDTTYSHLSASSGGTDVSLVTTGEMYNWNSKQDALSFDGTYNASTNKVATEDTVSSAVSGKADKSEMSITAGTGTTTIQLKSGLSTTVLTSHQDISGKADKSEMSVTAGTGTNSDKTTIQLKSGLSAVVLTSHQDISGKQDTISDLQDIRDGAGAGATAYQKPSSGIPSTDLASAVQTSLGKADTAYQKPSGGIPDTDLATAVQTSLGKADTAYQKPSGGIPDTDLASAVQTSLGKADSAYQKPSGGIPDTDLTTAVQSALTAAGTAIQGVKLNGTALTPDSNKAVNVTVNNATITIDMAGTAVSPNRSVGSFTADQAVASTITIPTAVSATPAVLGESDEVLTAAVPAQPGVLSSSDKDKLDSLFNVTGSDSISLNPSTHALSAIVAPDGGVVSGASGLIVQKDLVSHVAYVGNTCVYNDKEFWSDTSSVDSIINDYSNQTVTDYRGDSVPLVRFVSEYDSNRYRIACIDETPGTVDYNRKIGGQLVDLIRSDFWLSSVNGYDIIRFDKDMATLFDLLMSGSPMNAYLTLNNMSNTAFITDTRRELYMDMIKAYDAWPYADKDTAYSDFMDEHSLDRFVQVSTSWPLNSWNSYRYVMAGTKTATDKVIFVLRHAERGDDTSVNGDINSTGVTTCTTMGEQARNNASWTSSNVTYTIDNFPANNAAYYSTEYLRCKHSAQAFASARYDTDFDASDYSEITVEAGMLNQYRFFKQPASSGNSDLIRKYAVDPSQLTSTQLSENFGVSSAAEAEAKLASDYERVCKEILNKSTGRLNMFYTHDFFTLPLAVLASNKYFTFSGDSSHDNRNWINYCAGIGMILHPDDTYEVMPVRGKSNGSMTI